MRLEEVRRTLEEEGEVQGSCPGDLEVLRVTEDSREVSPGDLFVAVPGERVDGHRFIADAVRRGAGAVIISRDAAIPEGVPFLRVPDSRLALRQLHRAGAGFPDRRVAFVGVTGTNGKTTIATLVHAILSFQGPPVGLFGTTEYRVGDASFPSRTTTPGSRDLYRHLAELVREGGRWAVMEVSSHGIRQGRLGGLRFGAGVFSNLSPEHLDYHGTMDDYLDAKASFFASLEPDAVAVLNADDPSSVEIARRTRARIIRYDLSGLVGDTLAMVEGWVATRDGIRAAIRDGGTVVEMSSRLVGRHNVLNILAAVACARGLGISWEAIRGGISSHRPPPGRMEEIPTGRGFRLYIDYAHTDEALGTVLASAREISEGRIIVVFGCGGDRDRTKRPRMGARAEALADRVVVTSDNPRSEEPGSIIEEILSGMKAPGAALVEPDRRRAIEAAIRLAAPGDTVLIAGKGHETYQETNGVRLPFDDGVVAREILAGIAPGGVPVAGMGVDMRGEAAS